MRTRRILREKGMCTEFYKRHSRARESSCGNSRRKNRKKRKNDKLSWPKNCTFVERAYIYMYRRSDKSKKWENGEPTQPRDNRSFRTFCENNSCDFFRRLRARARAHDTSTPTKNCENAIFEFRRGDGNEGSENLERVDYGAE